MKIFYQFIAILCVGILFLASCSSDDQDTSAEYYNWEERNKTFFSDIYDKAQSEIQGKETDEWVIIPCYPKNNMDNKNNFIVVRILDRKEPHQEKDEKTGSCNRTYAPTPFDTDLCKIAYRGNLIPSKSFDYVVEPDYVHVGKRFDTSWTGNIFNLETAVFKDMTPTGTVDGFSTALQYMHPGDRWRVYMPCNLGYGAAEKTGIPAYSVLIFDIYMKEFTTNTK